MKKLTIAFIVASNLSLSACVTWPTLGSGGAAEQSINNRANLSTAEMTPEKGLLFEFELAKQHLDVMVLEGAEYCFPATVVQARHRQNRIIRELHGGLELDAANDLIIQRKLLSRLEQQLDYVAQHKVCTPPADDSLWQTKQDIEKISHLFNSGQQFETNSNVLTDSYTGQLAQASFLLRDLAGFEVHITGHAADSNQPTSLSLERAKMIQRYLQIFGLAPSLITIAAVDNQSPLFQQQDIQQQQTLRRVSIELVELSEPVNKEGE